MYKYEKKNARGARQAVGSKDEVQGSAVKARYQSQPENTSNRSPDHQRWRRCSAFKTPSRLMVVASNGLTTMPLCVRLSTGICLT